MNAAALLLALTTLAAPQKPEAQKITHDIVYGHKAGMALTYDMIQPSAPNGAAVIYVVSSGWFSMYFDPRAVTRLPGGSRFEALLDAGFTLFMVRHGSAPWFKVPDAVRDVDRAVRHVRAHAAEHGVDPERLGAMGDSAGGHLSLILGTQGEDGKPNSSRPESRAGSRVRAVVASFPPTDLRDYVGPSDRFPALDFDLDKAPRVSPILSATSDDAPTLLLHGTRDRLVPLSQSTRMRDALQAAEVEVELVIYEGAGHGFRNEHRDLAIKATVEWFEAHLLGD